MSLIDDYFLTTFFKGFNITYTLVVISIRLHSGEYESNQIFHMFTNHPNPSTLQFHVNTYFWTTVFPALIVLVAIFTASVFATIGKIKHGNTNSNVVAANVAGLNLNNNAFNQNMVSKTSSFVLVIAMIAIVTPVFAVRLFNVSTPKIVVTNYYFMYASSCLVFPAIFFLKKVENLKRAMSELFY